MGNSTISMAMFNSLKVCLPEGIPIDTKYISTICIYPTIIDILTIVYNIIDIDILSPFFWRSSHGAFFRHWGLERSVQTHARELRDDVPGRWRKKIHQGMGQVGTSPGKNWGNLSKNWGNVWKTYGKYRKIMENMEKYGTYSKQCGKLWNNNQLWIPSNMN